MEKEGITSFSKDSSSEARKRIETTLSKANKALRPNRLLLSSGEAKKVMWNFMRKMNGRDVVGAVVLGLALTFAGLATSLSLIISEGNALFLSIVSLAQWVVSAVACFGIAFLSFLFFLRHVKKSKKA